MGQSFLDSLYLHFSTKFFLTSYTIRQESVENQRKRSKSYTHAEIKLFNVLNAYRSSMRHNMNNETISLLIRLSKTNHSMLFINKVNIIKICFIHIQSVCTVVTLFHLIVPFFFTDMLPLT